MNWMRWQLSSSERGKRLGQRGLAHARDVLDQQVTLGEEADQGQPDGSLLALDGLLDVGDDGLEAVGEEADLTPPLIVVRPRTSSSPSMVGGGPAWPACERTAGAAFSDPSAVVTVPGVVTVLAIDIGGTKVAAAGWTTPA